MPIAPISRKVREILKDPIKGRELVREIRKCKPDKGGHQFPLKNKYILNPL